MCQDKYESTDAPEEGWKLRITQFETVVGAIMGLVLLILSIIAYVELSGFVSDYESVADSWTTTPITNITFIPAPAGCGSLEEVYSDWPGLYGACDCSTKQPGTNSTSTDTSDCDGQQTSDGCTDMPSLWGSITLGPFYGYSLCLTRGGPDTLQRTLDPTACLSTEMVCGEGFPLPFCWPMSAGPCPITDFLIDSVGNRNGTGADMEIAIGNGYYLYAKRGGRLSQSVWPDSTRLLNGAYDPTGLPLVTVEFEPATPCTLSGCGYSGRSSEYNSMSNAYSAAYPNNGYVQRPLPCDGGCSSPDVSNSVSPNGLDLRYQSTLYSITEQQLYTNYGVPSQFRTTNTAYVWSVFQKSEIEWSNTCQASRQDVVNRESDVKHVKSAQIALLVFGILSFIFLSVYFPCIMAFGGDGLKARSKTPNLICNIIVKVATLVCTIVTVVIAYSTLSFWDKVNASGGCADPLTDETFNQLGDKFSSLSYKNAISTAASSATGILDVLVTVAKRAL